MRETVIACHGIPQKKEGQDPLVSPLVLTVLCRWPRINIRFQLEKHPHLAVAAWCFAPARWLVASVIASVAVMAVEEMIQEAFDGPLMRGTTRGRTARSRATNLYRNLLAHHSWYTTGYRVRFTYLATLFDLNGLGVALTSAFGFANRTCTAFWNHFAHAVSAGLGLALGNHLARCVVTNFASVLTNHAANLVTNFLGSALGHHLAGGVVANLGAVLADRAANFVTNFFGSALRYHSTNGVIASFCTALRYHFTNTVGTSFGPTLWYNTANRVRHLACSAFASIPCAADFFLLASGYPDFLADGLGRTLDAFSAAFARRVDTLACTRIVSPSSRLTYGLFHDRSGNRLGLCFPVSAFDSHSPRVLFGNANTVLFCTHFLFANSVVNGVVHLTRLGLINRLAYGVVYRS